MNQTQIIPLVLAIALSSCSASSQTETPFAKVTAVEVISGEPGAYTFAVTVESSDTGCQEYADWWEVVDPQGNLIFRRVMAHSHVEEQPFQRTGGAIAIEPKQNVIVRTHLYPQGYGTQAMQGSVEQGFEKVTLPVRFAANLASVEPQPPECSF